MEAARIDWNTIDSFFVEDRLYEHFHAPKWIDLSSLDSSSSLSVDDDVSWFCKPDCNHPMTADDFLGSTPSPISSKTRRRRSSSHNQVLLLGDRNQGDVTFKRKGNGVSPAGYYEDGENKSPMVPAPPSPVGSTPAVNPSAENRKLADDDSLRADAIPRLKSTLSASNLFAGRELLKQISDFCGELKKLATRTKEKEFPGTRNKATGIPLFAKAKSSDIISSSDASVEGKERSPLLEVTEQASDVLKKSKVKEKKRTNRRVEDAENVPISIDLDKVVHKGHLSQIRTSPPTPQCFSATRGPPPESTSSPASNTRLKEQGRQILGEVKLARKDARTEENLNKGGGVGVVNGKTPDVFWFLKPCTMSS